MSERERASKQAREGGKGRQREKSESERAKERKRPGVVAEESRALEFVPLSLSIPASLALIALLKQVNVYVACVSIRQHTSAYVSVSATLALIELLRTHT